VVKKRGGINPGANIPDMQFDANYYEQAARQDEARRRSAQTGQPVPWYNYVPTNSFVGGGGTVARTRTGSTALQPTAVSQVTRPRVPAWLGGAAQPTRPSNPYNQMQDRGYTGRPGGSFVSGDGAVNTGIPGGPPVYANPSVFPTGSMLSGSGQVNTGIPVFPVADPLDDGSGGFGTQYGTNWRKRRGGGYGGYGGYNPSDYFPPSYLNLFSWNAAE
jgi:hypothetical protein